MTRDEAINTLGNFKRYISGGGVTDRKANEAIDMAIEVLQAEPVKHGKWEITEAYPHIVYCSECHKRYAQGNWPVWNDKDTPLPRNFCPNCGAKMDK